ncbi:Uncharacterised protein [Yersinia kristensenii]|nr:Uncharacterised protein [Yersinia kristensenii]
MIVFHYYPLAYPTRLPPPDFLLIKQRFILMNKKTKTETFQLNMNEIRNL